MRGCMCSVVLKKHIYKSTHITFYCTDLKTLTNSIILQIDKPSHISNIVFANTICCACKYYNCNMCECERMVCIVLFFKKKLQIMCSVVLQKYIYKLRKVCVRSYISWFLNLYFITYTMFVRHFSNTTWLCGLFDCDMCCNLVYA